MKNIVTVREATLRAKADGLPISEYTLRRWIKTGAIPVRNIGNKALLFYPNLMRFVRCEDGADNIPTTDEAAPGIRQVEI